MVYQRIHQPSTRNPQTQQKSSIFARHSVFQAKGDSQKTWTHEQQENEVSRPHKIETSGLQRKEKRGTITPIEQERLGVLQAKMDDIREKQQDRASRFHIDMTQIPVQSSDYPMPKPIQKQGGMDPTRPMKSRVIINDDDAKLGCGVAASIKKSQIKRGMTIPETRQDNPRKLKETDSETRAAVVIQPAKEGGFFDFTKYFSGEHDYENKTFICHIPNQEAEETIKKKTYQSLRKNPAPAFQDVTVSESDEPTELSVTFLGKVTSAANPTDKSVTNTTQEGHMLHPGTVKRTVVSEQGKVYIQTKGYGSGLFPTLNNWLAWPVWHAVDLNIVKELNPEMTKQYENKKITDYL